MDVSRKTLPSILYHNDIFLKRRTIFSAQISDKANLRTYTQNLNLSFPDVQKVHFFNWKKLPSPDPGKGKNSIGKLKTTDACERKILMTDKRKIYVPKTKTEKFTRKRKSNNPDRRRSRKGSKIGAKSPLEVQIWYAARMQGLEKNTSPRWQKKRSYSSAK